MAVESTQPAEEAPRPGDDSIRARSLRIIEEFSGLDDPIERYRHLVTLAEASPRLADAERTDEARIPGCQYGLWITTAYDERRGVLHFRADSDAKVTRGLAALLVRVLDGQPPAAIEEAELDFLDTIGLRGHLSAHRASGLSAMIQEMRSRARQYRAAPSHRSNGRHEASVAPSPSEPGNR